ncbi:MAG: asparaginase [Actinobacteria bacterium]|nr:asparaginase [Acidobacteriota bacterium]MCA1702814.1 asparaginase [Actinomycetota bacterium]
MWRTYPCVLNRTLARAFSTIASASCDSIEHNVSTAMRIFLDWTGGPGRQSTELMRCMPTIIAKEGAEGVYVASFLSARHVH